ncbi:MAG: NAD(P)-binding domain-containing protein [Vulcanimicrobiaceae bacterium]
MYEGTARPSLAERNGKLGTLADASLPAGDSARSQVAIVGAGPYGLSLAAHLRARAVDFRIFGGAMDMWRKHMPKGMFLKSEGFASCLSDPDGTFTLERYCREHGITYGDVGVPVALETFVAYGLAFQRRFVPHLDERIVAEIARDGDGFELRLADGERVRARQVVIAVGISHYAYVPPVLARLPADFVSHTSSFHELDCFAGRDVTVIGAGASAVDVAGLLHVAGAATRLVANVPELQFQDPPKHQPRTLWQRVRYPRSGLGSGWKSRLIVDFPVLFHRLPERFRWYVVQTHLGPAPCWFTRQQIVGKVATVLGVRLEGAEIVDGRVRLRLAGSDGSKQALVTDHVIAGTGYRVDLDRLKFLAPPLRALIRSSHGAPVLSSDFEASVPGLFFVGVSAANSFGPLLRFAYGAKFSARRLSARLAARRERGNKNAAARRADAERAAAAGGAST